MDNYPMNSLDSVLHNVLPQAVQQLSDSHHLENRPHSSLASELQQYSYSFAKDPRYRPQFGSFTFPWEEKQKHRAVERREGEERDEDEDDHDEWTLANAQAEADTSGLAGEYSRARKGKPCGHVFKKGESVYRCKECSLDESCVLCAKCFKSSSHEGHEVSFSMHSGTGGSGCCDCGDEEAFRCEIDCAYHNVKVPYPAGSSSSAESMAEPSPTSQTIPPEVLQLIRRRIQEAVEFILQTVTQFPRDVTAPAQPRTISTTRPTYRAPYESYDRHDSFPGPWSVILWNDEKHTYDQVIDQLVNSTRCSRNLALASAVRVDNYGLEVVATSTDSTKLWKIAHIIGSIDLGVTVCTTRDAVVLEAVGYLMDWLLDIAKVRIGGEETLLGRLVAEVLVDKQQFSQLLMQEDKLWKRARSTFRYLLMSLLVVGQDVKLELGRQYAGVYPTLISSYLLTDREPESSVTYFSVQLFSAPSVATELVTKYRFLEVVMNLLYSFFTRQHKLPNGEKGLVYPPSREHPAVDPESSSFKPKRYLNIFQEMNHLLSHPAVLEHIVAQTDDSLDCIIQFLNLFTGMNPHTRASAVHVEYETDSWVSAFNLAIQLSKLARSVGKAFHPTPGRMPSYKVPVAKFSKAIGNVLSKIMSHMNNDMPSYTKSHFVQFAAKRWYILDYKVASSPVSFHHPLHLLYAEALKYPGIWPDGHIYWNEEDPSEGRFDSFAQFIQNVNLTSTMWPWVIDEVIRVLALLAQVRAGLWVRNGFGIRAQALHYREYTLRENTFDQDIYFMQTAFVTIEPSFILVNMLDRFQILDTLMDPVVTEGRTPFADFQQARAVLEEFLYLLVVIFSEPTDIEYLSTDQVVRREVVHALLLGSLPYSDVIKNVTERAGEETSFDRILREVADFRAPDLTTVSSDVGGVYTLKKECYAENDPYYYRYTRNQREEAIKILKAHFDNNGVFVPRKLQAKGPFKSGGPFTATLLTPVFVDIIRLSIRFAVRPTATNALEVADTVLDLALRLISIALVEESEAFCQRFAQDDEEHGGSLVRYLVMLEAEKDTKEHHAKVTYILDKIAQTQPQAITKWRQLFSERQTPAGQEEPPSSATLADQKRIAAKERQAAIMQKFAAQQQAFLDANLSDEEDEDEDEDDLGTVKDQNKEPQVEEQPISAGANAADLSTATIVQEEMRSKRKRKAASLGSCIVCQEELNAQTPFGSLALVQTSSLIRLSPPGEPFLQEVYAIPTDLDKDADHLRPFGIAGQGSSEKEGRGGTSYGFPRQTRKGLFASACGHMMHVACFETYCASIQQRHTTQFTRNHPENPERKEFICPLCKSLGNILLPVSDDDYEEGLAPPAGPLGISDDWLNSMLESLSYVNPDLKHAIHLLPRSGSGEMRAWRIQDSLPSHHATFGFASISQAERRMLERLVNVISPLDAESRMLDPAPEERGARTIPHELISYTISAVEIALRGKPTGTLSTDSIPHATAQLLRSLLSALERLVVLSTGTPRGPDFARLALLWTMFGNRSVSQSQHFLNRDPFTVLVESAAIAPNDFHQFATLTFYANLLRISYKLYHDNTNPTSFSGAQSLTADATALADFCVMLQEDRWARTGEHVTDAKRLRARTAAERAHAHALPFLRRAAILRNTIFTASRSPSSEGSEFSRLMELLHIPHPRDLTGRKHGKAPQKTTSLASILETWDTAWLLPSHDYLQPSIQDKILLEHPVIYELLGLPKHIDVLVESTVIRKCKKCRTVPANPAICLMCGELVCQQNHCCMDQDLGEEPLHGECNMHMWECGTSTGIYFLIKKNAIIYLYADKGAFVTAPYLDSHGEPDLGFRKHRPLYLNQARYDEIRKLWLNHSIATLVARKLESGSDAGGWNTF